MLKARASIDFEFGIALELGNADATTDSTLASSFIVPSNPPSLALKLIASPFFRASKELARESTLARHIYVSSRISDAVSKPPQPQYLVVWCALATLCVVLFPLTEADCQRIFHRISKAKVHSKFNGIQMVSPTLRANAHHLSHQIFSDPCDPLSGFRDVDPAFQVIRWQTVATGRVKFMPSESVSLIAGYLDRSLVCQRDRSPFLIRCL